jgi:DNA gyrase/topoisomerase IV subunit A
LGYYSIISESKDTFAAAQNLMEKYSLSNDVALDIMNCSLLSLNKEKKALCKKEEKILKNKIMSINELINRIKL